MTVEFNIPTASTIREVSEQYLFSVRADEAKKIIEDEIVPAMQEAAEQGRRGERIYIEATEYHLWPLIEKAFKNRGYRIDCINKKALANHADKTPNKLSWDYCIIIEWGE